MIARVIELNRTGDETREQDLEEFRTFEWSCRKKVVFVNGEMVLDFSGLLSRACQSTAPVEIVLMSPLVGG